jgi:hypothetical protein
LLKKGRFRCSPHRKSACAVRIPTGFRKIEPNRRAGTALGHMSHHPSGARIMTAVGAPARAVIAALLFGLPVAEAAAGQVNIVVIGDNNVRGRGVAESEAYPAQLERALRARGLDVAVKNAGRDYDTTTGVMARLDSAAPAGTDVAVVSIGVNDVVMHGSSPDASKANVREIARRLRARGIEVVLLRTGGKFQSSLAARPAYHVEKGRIGPPPGTTEWHLTGEGYAIIAEQTLPQVQAAVERAQQKLRQ